MITIKGVKYMELKEYAKYKGVVLKTVYEWIKEKKVKTRVVFNTKVIRL
jgi:predicted site-specific integrase-resolvase